MSRRRGDSLFSLALQLEKLGCTEEEFEAISELAKGSRFRPEDNAFEVERRK
jgi:hypothetical protein